MLTVTSFWSNSTFQVSEVSEDLAATVNESFHKRFPSGALLVDMHLVTGELSEPGAYRFLFDDEGNTIAYYRVDTL